MKTVVYGARCVWWDTIDKAATLPGGLPCCPHCKSVLFEMDLGTWWKGIDHHAASNPGYREMMMWSQSKCFRDMKALEAAYQTER